MLHIAATLAAQSMRAGAALVRAAFARKTRVRIIARSRIPFRIRVGPLSLTGFGSSRSLAQYRSPRALANSAGPGASRYWVVVQSRFTRKGTPRWILRRRRDPARGTGFDSYWLCGAIVSGDFGRILSLLHTTYRLSAEKLVNIPSNEVGSKSYPVEFRKELRETTFCT